MQQGILGFVGALLLAAFGWWLMNASLDYARRFHVALPPFVAERGDFKIVRKAAGVAVLVFAVLLAGVFVYAYSLRHL